MKKLIASLLLLIAPFAFSNPYYTATGNPQPFARESSQVIANEFQLIQNGFSLIPNLSTIPTYAVATGTANTYLVTLSTTPSAYTNGMVVNFYTSNPNTGASTLNVMGSSGYLGAVPILESTGGPLVSGDILSTAVVTVVYSGGSFYLTSGQTLPTQSSNANKFLTTNGTSASWSLVPLASGTTGILPAANGGTGTSSITGIHYGNGSSPVTQATASQIVSAIGSTPVSEASNLNGGTAANQIPYQTGTGTTAYMSTPASGTMLYFDGTNFDWEPTATTLTNLGIKATGTDTTYAYRSNNLSDLANTNTALNNLLPSQSGKSGLFLQSNGTSTTWAAASGGSGLTSVGLSMPTAFQVSGSPLTANGTLSVTYSGTAIPIANGGTGATSASAALTALGGAPLVSPNFTGTPQISSSNIITSSSLTSTLSSYATTSSLSSYAPLSSPAFTGTPTVGGATLITSANISSQTVASAANGGVTSVNSKTGAVSIKGLGLGGESWNNVTGSRAVGTTYTNSYSYPMMVFISGAMLSTGSNASINVGSVSFQIGGGTASAAQQSGSVIVPSGATYSVTTTGSFNLETWSELY